MRGIGASWRNDRTKDAEVNTLLQTASAVAACLAAWYWFKSTLVRTPSSFPITVVSVHSLREQVIGAQVISTGSSPELDQIGEALIKQSHLNGQAAVFAGVAAVL